MTVEKLANEFHRPDVAVHPWGVQVNSVESRAQIKILSTGALPKKRAPVSLLTRAL